MAFIQRIKVKTGSKEQEKNKMEDNKENKQNLPKLAKNGSKLDLNLEKQVETVRPDLSGVKTAHFRPKRVATMGSASYKKAMACRDKFPVGLKTVRRIADRTGCERISEDSLKVISEMMTKSASKLLKMADLMAKQAGRSTIKPSDLITAEKMLNHAKDL